MYITVQGGGGAARSLWLELGIQTCGGAAVAVICSAWRSGLTCQDKKGGGGEMGECFQSADQRQQTVRGEEREGVWSEGGGDGCGHE